MTLSELTVLVVEPSFTQHRIIKDAVLDCGVNAVLDAADGKTALQTVHELQPDLVISSLYLPDMTGTDLVEAIRHGETHSDTAFMLISSETRFRYLDPIRQAGAVSILPKPFCQEDLLIALKATVDLVDDDAMALAELEPETLRVLVVDDSPMARKHVSRVLATMGIEHIDQACDGIEALEKINQDFYDFVVTDYNMPNMDGAEMVDRIRSTSSQASIPILMVTSEENENRLAAVQASGVSAICDKPFEPRTVKHLVTQLMRDH